MQARKPTPIFIPENYYGISENKTTIIFPDMITCMGICITSYSNKKIFAHCADLSGFPVKIVTSYMHPLPHHLQAFEKDSGFIFKFLLDELKVQSAEIKRVTIFGNFKTRTDIFGCQRSYVSQQNVKTVLSQTVGILAERIAVLPCRQADACIDVEGNVSIIYKGDRIDQVSGDNYRFYDSMREKGLSLAAIRANFSFFCSRDEPREYFTDDFFVRYRH